MAWAAVPERTVVSFVSVISFSWKTGVFFRDWGPLWVTMSAVSGRPWAWAMRVMVRSTSKPPTAPEARCTFTPFSRAADSTRARNSSSASAPMEISTRLAPWLSTGRAICLTISTEAVSTT